jgi:hypothetical protein
MIRRLLWALAILAAPAAASAATRVYSDSNCPSSDAISTRLLGLIPAHGPEGALARVYDNGQSLRIELSTPSEPNQQRTIPVTADCEERAELAALLIASWLDVMPEGGHLKPPGIPPRETGEIVRISGGGRDPDAPQTRTSTRTLIGAGLLGMVDENGASTGLVLSASMPDLVEDFGLLFDASLGLPRSLGVGQGTAKYYRPTLALKASAAVFRKHWRLRVVVGPALGVLSVSGSGYVENLSDTTVMWGLDFGLVLARAWDQNEAWVSLGSDAWPQGRQIRSKPDSMDIGVTLPQWEGRLIAGFSWGVLDR